MEVTAVEVACKNCRYWYRTGKSCWGTCTAKLNQRSGTKGTYGKRTSTDSCGMFLFRVERKD